MIALMASIEACGGSSAPTSPATPPATNTPVFAWTQPSIPAGLSTTVRTMLLGLTTYLGQALSDNQDLLPRNPQSVTEIQAKIAMLQNASLAVDIVNGQRGNRRRSMGAPFPWSRYFLSRACAVKRLMPCMCWRP